MIQDRVIYISTFSYLMLRCSMPYATNSKREICHTPKKPLTTIYMIQDRVIYISTFSYLMLGCYTIKNQGCITNSKREICHTPKTPTLKNIYDLRKESYIFLSLTNIYLYVTLYSVKTSTNYLALNPSHLYHYIMLVCCVHIILRGECMNIQAKYIRHKCFRLIT